MFRPPSPPPLPGDQVGPYTLLEMRGVGGMATVYRATSLEHPVAAVKILHPGKADTEEARRFRREFLTLKELQHPGIVRVYEAGTVGDYPWIAMEYVDGTDLGQLIDAWRKEPPPDRFLRSERILRVLCGALEEVHSRGMIHRDLKPSNVLVDQQGQPKLTDFGVVKAPGGLFTTQLTIAGKLVGTVAFMAPEHIMAEAIDQRADLYSLGAVLYMMLTGERPIVADNIAGYLARHLTVNPRPPVELDPQVPPRLNEICVRLLRKDPAQRYPSARHVLEALDAEEQAGPPLFGRDGELERLLHRTDRLHQRKEGGLLLILAQRGVGRSSLLAELVHRSRAAGRSVASCNGTESEPLERLLAQMGPSAGARQLSHAERLAERSRGQPWLLVIDDIDHLSPPDREALTWLLRNSVAIEGEPLLVVAAALHKEGGALASGEATGLSVEKLVLGPLDRRSVVQLVRELGVGGSAGAVLGNRLHEELGGVPAMIIEQVQAMARAGWLARAPEGGLRSTRSNDALRDDPLPRLERSGKGGDRLGRLDPVARRVLDALCVLNLEATIDLVAEVAGLDVGSVERGISLLAGDGLARRWVDGMQELIGLGTMGRDALYGHVEPDLRAELHRNAAAALKRRARRRVGAMAEEMAGHLLCGGQMAEAWPLLVEAATRRARAGEVDEARRLMRQALDAGPAAEARLNPEEALRLRQSLHSLEGDLLERGGDLTGAQHAWERALGAAVERGDREGSARARAGLGLARVARGESLEARPLLERVLAELPPGDPHWGRVALALAEARLALDELEPAEKLWRQVEEQSRLTQAQGVLGEALLGRALCELCRMEQRRALDHLTEAEDLLRAAGPAWALARCLLVLAEAALVDGRLIEAQDRAAEADRIARELPRPALLAWAQGLSAEILYARGRLDEGRLAAQEAAALAFARCRGENLHQLYALCWVARPLCRAGGQEQAAALLPDPPLGLPPGLEDPAALCAGVRAWALAPFEARRAVQHAQQALFRSPGPRLPWLSARLAIDLCHALVEVGDPAAVGAAREAIGRTAAPGLRLLRLEALRMAARLEPALGWRAEADELLQRIAQEQGAPAELISRWGSA